ncbi:MAG: ATP-binding protein [Dermatophilaceae bacterium]
MSTGPRVLVTRTGSFGQVRAEDATSLAMIVSELVQNAVEHGLAARGGTVTVDARRRQAAKGGDQLVMTVVDDGVGLPGGVLAPGQGLGTQIVQSLVQDLRGKITWSAHSPSGTRVRLTAQLRRLEH